MREHARRLEEWEKKKKADYTPLTVQLIKEAIAQGERDGSLIPMEKVDHIELFPDRTIAVMIDGAELDVTPAEMRDRIKKMQAQDAKLSKK